MGKGYPHAATACALPGFKYGRLITGNRLKTMFEAGSTSTIMDYLSHFEYSYLFHFVPKFSYSLRKQLINPRKVDATDLGLINANSGSFTEDFGSLLENLVFLHLRRQGKDICYFSEKGITASEYQQAAS